MSLPDDTQFPLQWHFDRIGDISSIWADYTGAGITVGVYDDGVQYTHGDLDGNYNAALHVVIDGVTYDGLNATGFDGHGTSVAGLIAAERNGEGTVGIAYSASITGVNVFDDASALFINAAVPTQFYQAIAQSASFDVVNNSWGSTPSFASWQNANTFGDFAAETLAGWQFAALNGRGGLGTIVVKSAGNDYRDSNGDNLNSSRYTVTVNAVGDSGFAASYSNHGFNSLVSAPGSEFASNGGLGIVTTDLLGADGYNLRGDPTGSYDYTDSFGGTSAAGPIVAAVTALMLDANPNLGWRDVHNILATSATHTGSALGATVAGAFENGTWLFNSAANWNGGGMHFHTNYGYGMVNAYNAARMAEVWSLFAPAQTSANEVFAWTGTIISGAVIPSIGTVSTSFAFAADLIMESVSLTLSITHSYWTDLRIFVTSPEGTRAQLVDGLSGDFATASAGLTWTFGVEAFRGESSAGNWTIEIEDVEAPDGGILESFEIAAFGTLPSADDVYHYTDEFTLLSMLDNSRRLLTDANGGTDWVNLAAMHGNLSINLANLAYSSVNGQQLFRIANGTVIENVVAGDGNDTLRGNAVGNHLLGMRGNDSLFGLGGDDTLDGGRGVDTLTGGLGNDTYINPTGDIIVELAGGGTDTVESDVTFSLAALAQVENLTLTGTGNIDGTGNAAANSLTGNSGNNRLDGGAGSDTLIGGLGNDIYVNPLGDIITELAGGGTDTVESNATFSLAALAHVENITLTGTANVNAAGNAADNVLIGNAGNNILNGSTGIDTMIGGAGNDTYFVDRGGDLTIEEADGGIDLVSSSISRTLSANIENLNLSGTANIDGNGNELDNTINGNTGNNVMRGYAGNDVIRGNAGADTIVGGLGRDSINPGDDADRDIIRYASVAESTGVTRDLITGMDLANEDRFDFPAIPSLIRAQVNAGTLSTASFDADLATAIGAGQLGAGQAVLFDPSAGNLNIAGRVYLIVDANGIAGYQAGQDYVIELSNHIGTLTLDDFI